MKTLTPIALTESPAAGSVDDEYFYKMLSPYALRLSAPFNDEESDVLEQCLRTNPAVRDMNFVAVGGGELWELRKAAQYAKRYVCIEPLADMFLNDSVKYLAEQFNDVSVIPKRLGEVVREELPDGNSFFMFLFNILAYIENPIDTINRLIVPGDILFISTWADTPEAKATRLKYFQYLNESQNEVVIDPEQSVGLSRLDHFPFSSLKSFKESRRIKGKTADILVIYA